LSFKGPAGGDYGDDDDDDDDEQQFSILKTVICQLYCMGAKLGLSL
jgi:hypothetical protein